MVRTGDLAGRYELLGTLSTKPERSVVLARDRRRGGRKCALKIFPGNDPALAARAQREYRIVHRLRQPGIAEVFDFGRLDRASMRALSPDVALDAPYATYLASVYYDGENLRATYLDLFDKTGEDSERVAREESARWSEFLRALARVAQALDAIHRQGIVHRDIKPENLVFVREKGAAPGDALRPTILDFGLSADETKPADGHPGGTVPFVAPELMNARPADRRSDLFSLGVSLAYAITGRPPFPGDTPAEWVQAANTGARLRVSDTEPGTPPDLDDLIDRLLDPDPDRRPPDARAVAEELERIGGFRLAAPVREARPRVPRVGWESELAHVETLLEELERGEVECTICIYEADEGQFLDEFAGEIELRILSRGTSCYSGAGRLPRQYAFQPFAEIFVQIAREIDLSAVAPELGLTEAHLNAVRRIAPVEGDVAAPLPSIDAAREPERLRSLIADVLLALARDRPVALLLRDVELGGPETLKLLETIHRSATRLERSEDDAHDEAASMPRLLVVATTSAGDRHREAVEGIGPSVDLGRFLQRASGTRRVLQPLAADRVPEWIRERAPELDVPPDVMRRWIEVSQGSPRLLDEFIRRARGEPSSADILDYPRRHEEAMLQRLDGLGTDARSIVEILAAAGTPLRTPILDALRAGDRTEPTSAETTASVGRLERAGLVSRRDGISGEEIGIASPSLASHVYRMVAAPRRREIHRGIAAALHGFARDEAPCRVPEDVAHHARLARWDSLAADQTLVTADRLASSQAIAAAALQLETLLEAGGRATGRPGSKLDPLVPLAVDRLATLYAALRQPEKARERLTFLSSLYEGEAHALARAEVLRRIGESYLESGEIASALLVLELSESLFAGGASSDPASANSAPRLLDPDAELGRTRLALARAHLARGERSATERLARCIAEAPDGGDAAARCRAFILLAETARADRRSEEARDQLEHALAIARDSQNLALHVETTIALGNQLRDLGEYDRATEILEEGGAVASQLASQQHRAAVHKALGTTHHDRGEQERALVNYRIALRLAGNVGDEGAIADNYNNLGLVYQVRDDLGAARECYERAIELYTRLNDRAGMARALGNLSTILEREGNYGEALDYAFRALDKRKRSAAPAAVGFSYYRIGKIYLAQGELTKAAAYAQRGLELRERIDERLGAAYSRLQLAQIALARGELAAALSDARSAHGTFRALRNRLGVLVAREVEARFLAAVGRLRSARRVFASVEASARELDQPLLRASCLLGRARVERESGQHSPTQPILAEAESVFRSAASRREVVEVLLERAWHQVSANRSAEAERLLEEAYEHLEILAIRDLVPLYFLLRGRLEIARQGDGWSSRARRYLVRGLKESRDAELPDLAGRFHASLSDLAALSGDAKESEVERRSAVRAIESMLETAPPSFAREMFFPRERARLRGGGDDGNSTVADAPATSSPATSPPVGPQLLEETRRLHEIAGLIGRESDKNRLLRELLRSVLELVAGESGFVLLKEDGARPQIVVACDRSGSETPPPQEIVSDSVVRRVLESGETVLIRNALDEDDYQEAVSVQRLKLRSILCAPLRFRGATLGLIYIDNRWRTDAFRDADVATLQAFADQAAIAVTNAQLVDENRRQTEELVRANRKLDLLNQKLQERVARQNEQLALVRESLRERQRNLEERYSFRNIVGRSPAMRLLYYLIERVAPTPLSVLIEGESGTGKELIARALHYTSDRRGGPFVSASFGMLSGELLESELFGHERGAFTGASEAKTGLFEQANGGTIFLDEVDELALDDQRLLLRVLQEGEVRPIGGRPRTIDVRVIAAADRPVSDRVDDGTFRKDLYYRLNGIRIPVPSLRDRKEDIPVLVDHFCTEFARESGGTPPKFLPDAVAALTLHDWPGNVRELKSIVERNLLVRASDAIGAKDLIMDSSVATASESGNLREARERFEREFLERCLAKTRGNVSEAARVCGVSRETLYRLLRKHGLNRGSAG